MRRRRRRRRLSALSDDLDERLESLERLPSDGDDFAGRRREAKVSAGQLDRVGQLDARHGHGPVGAATGSRVCISGLINRDYNIVLRQ